MCTVVGVRELALGSKFNKKKRVNQIYILTVIISVDFWDDYNIVYAMYFVFLELFAFSIDTRQFVAI